MEKKTIYIGIEIKARELLSKIILSYFAIKNNYRIIIGSKEHVIKYILNKKNKGGIFLYKGDLHKNIIRPIVEKLNYHVILDQEIIPGATSEYYKKNIRYRFYPENLKYIDLYLAASKQIESITKRSIRSLQKKVVFTGLPTFDLVNSNFYNIHKEKILEIKKKYGKFLLLNSNFSSINEYSKILEYTPWGMRKGEIKNHIYKSNKLANSVLHEFNNACNFIKDISKKIKMNIIIRPHPSENLETWNNIFNNYPNIKIIPPHDSVIPWIYSCEKFLHRGCSTAYFAYLIGKPIGFLKLNNKEIIVDRIATIKVSSIINNFIDLNKWLKLNKSRKKINKNKMYKFLGINKKKSSSESIIILFNKLKITKENIENIKNKLQYFNFFLHYYFIFTHFLIKNTVVFLVKNNLLKKNINKYYRTPKLGDGIKEDEIKYFLNKLNIKKFTVKKISYNLISIQ